MYIITSTYGGMDWHDSRTIHEQLKMGDSYNIKKESVPDVIADDIARYFPYVEDIRENVLQALLEKSCFQFAIKEAETDNTGNVTYKNCETYDIDGQTYMEREAVFDGCELTLSQYYAYGQVSYLTTYYVIDIPNDQLGYIVTEDFLAPAKGVPLVGRLYHDIFDEQEAAQNYAENLKLHNLIYPSSIVTLLVCNKGKVSQTKWYQKQKEAMELMKEKRQTYLCDSFHIFAEKHIEKLRQL